MSEYPVPPTPAPDGLLVTPVWTTITTPFDAMTEQRKAKQVFAKYDVSLKYPEGMTNADIMTLWAFYMARRGAYQAFYIYDLLSQAHVGLFVGWGDGTTTTFDIPGKTTSSQTVYKDGSPVSLSSPGPSGSVTLANMRLSLVNGTAFVDFSAAGTLTPYLGGKLTLTDSAGKKAVGYIKAAGTGETYGSELVTNGDFETGNPPTGWSAGGGATLSSVADERSGGAGTASMNILRGSSNFAVSRSVSGLVLGASYLVAGWVKNVDAAGGAGIGMDAGFGLSYSTSTSWTQTTFRYLATATAKTFWGMVGGSAGQQGRIDDYSIKQVLTPSSTGVTITSTPGGTTYNWASIESGFNYNDAGGYKYEIVMDSILEGGGAEDSDRVTFVTPPALGTLITCDLTGYLRMRVRFKEDKFSRQSLTHLISAGGTIELKGLSPEDL